MTSCTLFFIYIHCYYSWQINRTFQNALYLLFYWGWLLDTFSIYCNYNLLYLAFVYHFIIKNIIIKTYLEKDLVMATTNNLWLHSFYYSKLDISFMFHGSYINLIQYSFHYNNVTFIYFLRELFPLCVSYLISLKILYWVTRLVNFLSRIFQFWRVNSKKMVNIWCNTPISSPTL